MEKVSIIIPVYKAPEIYLRKCIESCINQTYKDIETILVDDGSLDHCGYIFELYAKKDNRIQVYHINNGSDSVARNCDLQKVKNEYVMFLDSDNWIEINTI